MTEAIAEERMGWKRTKDGLLLVPGEHQEAILWEHHDSMVAGHWGAARTAEFILRNYSWPNLRARVEAYVIKCDRCQRAKPDRHARKTALKPMPIGNGPWQEIAMDFVVALPESEGFNAILVVTCRFSRMVRHIPCCYTWNSQLLAQAFIKEVWRHFGLPKAITSDRDPRMV